MKSWVIESDNCFVALAPEGPFWTAQIEDAFRVARRVDAQLYWHCFGEQTRPVKFVEVDQ